MIIDEEISLVVISSVIIYKLRRIGIESKINDKIIIPINKLWIGSNILVNVKCDICGLVKKLQYNLYNKNIKKYNIYCCSNKCSSFKNKKTCEERYGNKNYANIEKAKETRFQKYGDEKFNNIEKIKKTKLDKYGSEKFNNIEKIKSTNLERYGKTNTFQIPEFKEKTRITNLQKYGCEDSRSSEYVKEKRINTTKERYGVDFYTKTEEYLDKVKNTSIEKYGVSNPNMAEVVKKNKVESMVKKYGFISNSISEESKKKIRDTNLERYGVEYPMQVLEFLEKQQKNSKKIRYYNDLLYYQSSYEKHFLEYMDFNKLLDSVQRGFSIRYFFEGKNKIHYPDFYIDNHNLIVEIKSHYYYNKYLDQNISKMNKCIELGYNYLFIINKNYKALNSILNIE